jgi:hypothetical protein
MMAISKINDGNRQKMGMEFDNLNSPEGKGNCMLFN